MARPSRRTERTGQILDAAETCIIEQGLAGTSLDRIAARAGLARPLIRHNLGNREAVLAAVLDRFSERGEALLEEISGQLPRHLPYTTLVQRLFMPVPERETHARLASALVLAGTGDPDLSTRVALWRTGLIGTMTRIAGEQFPGCSQNTCEAVSIGIIGIWLSQAGMASGSETQRIHQSALVSALMLVAMMEIENG